MNATETLARWPDSWTAQGKITGRWEGLIRRRLQQLQSRSVYAIQHWQVAQGELMRERGVLGCTPRLRAQHCSGPEEERGHTSVETWIDVALPGRKRRCWWRLDNAEGPQRMRRRLELDGQEMAKVRSRCALPCHVGV